MKPTIRRLVWLPALLLTMTPALAQEVGAGILQGLQGQRTEAPEPEADDPALPFTATPALRAATVDREVQRLRAENPIAAAETAREMAKHDYDAIFRSFLADTPLRAEDAGDVLTAFIVLQWMVANDATAEPSPAALRAIRRRFVAPMAVRPPLSQPDTRAAFAEQVKLRSVLHHAGWKAAKQLGVLPRFLATLSGEFIPAAKLRALALTDDGLVARDGSGPRPAPAPLPPAGDRAPPPAKTPAPPPVADAGPPRHAANWDAVEGVYFRSTTGFGVGGMMIVAFEPLILLRDGTTYEIDDAALEDVDLAAERAAHPRRFGRWTRTGKGFVLTGTAGKPVDYTPGDGSFFPAFPAGAGERVARAYRRLSGGGNSALGGSVTVAVENRYDFHADGSYGRGGSVGALNSGADTGVGTAIGRRRAPESGRYALDRYTLTLTGADGRSRRLFFAYGAQKNPPEIDRDMIFVGDSVFTPVD